MLDREVGPVSKNNCRICNGNTQPRIEKPGSRFELSSFTFRARVALAEKESLGRSLKFTRARNVNEESSKGSRADAWVVEEEFMSFTRPHHLADICSLAYNLPHPVNELFWTFPSYATRLRKAGCFLLGP